jgi:hypothetical protein
VGGKVTPVWQTPRPAWLPDALLSYLSLVDWGPERTTLSPPKYLAGTNIAYPADLLRRLGGFRTDLGRAGESLVSNEELEMCDRIRAGGFDIVYCPQAVVAHAIPAGRLTQPWFRRRVFCQAVSDAVMNAPKRSVARAPALDDYFGLLASADRSVDRLFSHQEDPELFHRQCKAIYGLAQLLFKGETSAPG